MKPEDMPETGLRPKSSRLRPSFYLPDGCDEDLWVRAVVGHYRAYYNWSEPNRTEMAGLQVDRAYIHATMPERLKTGVHLIGPNAAHCGEDICVVDGVLTHNIWYSCPVCRTGLLARKDDPSRAGQAWCRNCNDWQDCKGR